MRSYPRLMSLSEKIKEESYGKEYEELSDDEKAEFEILCEDHELLLAFFKERKQMRADLKKLFDQIEKVNVELIKFFV